MVRADALHGLSQLCLRVLDDVAFVKNAVVPTHALETSDVISNNFVRCDHNVMFLQLRDELIPLSCVAGIHDGLQIFCVLEDLVVPVARQRRRTYNERRKVSRIRRLGLLIAFGALVVFTRQNAN